MAAARLTSRVQVTRWIRTRIRGSWDAPACALGALIAGRAGLVAIPLGLAIWMIIGVP